MGFNKAQTEAITHQNGPMLVLAGPGSGKTLVITKENRIFNSEAKSTTRRNSGHYFYSNPLQMRCGSDLEK